MQSFWIIGIELDKISNKHDFSFSDATFYILLMIIIIVIIYLHVAKNIPMSCEQLMIKLVILKSLMHHARKDK